MAATVQGFLKKKRHKFINKWTQRWFVLRGNTIYWYADKYDKHEAGSAHIEAGSTVVKLPESEYNQFSLCTPKFCRHFQTKSPREFDMWFNALRQVINSENAKNPKAAALRPKRKNVLQNLFRKRRSSLSDKSTSPYRGDRQAGAVFGIDLSQLDGPGTPDYLHGWYDYLSRYGFTVRGLLRKPGENNLMQKLRGMYDKGMKFDLKTEVGGTNEASVHCVASLLKLFFRETRVPLFPEGNNEFLKEASKHADDANVVFLLGKAVAQFSKCRQNIIKDLFLFLHEISLHSDENLMSANNLAVCLTPSLFQTNSFKTLEDLAALKPLTEVTAKYIKFADKISFAGRRASFVQQSDFPTPLSSEKTPVGKHRPISAGVSRASRSRLSGKSRSQSVDPALQSASAKPQRRKSISTMKDKAVVNLRPKSANAATSSEKLTAKPRSQSLAVTASDRDERARQTEQKLAAAGWESKKTDDGRVFYFHREEQRSSWSADGIVNCWIQVDSKGKTYYYHSHTHERRWEKPEDF